MDPGEKDETEMRHPLVGLFRQATRTFAPRPRVTEADFPERFDALKVLLDRVRAEDVRLDPSFGDRELWQRPGKAPCTYIEIFQNHHLNMSIFVLKPGFTMPLHDHPKMYGLLKVISGRVRIRCLSRATKEIIAKYRLGPPDYDKFYCTFSQDEVCDADSESCSLTPDDSNYHEIESLDGPSAFLDILAPPYSTSIKDDEERQCKYYQIFVKTNMPVVQLEEIPLPNTFYCDQAPYLGPVLI